MKLPKDVDRTRLEVGMVFAQQLQAFLLFAYYPGYPCASVISTEKNNIMY